MRHAVGAGPGERRQESPNVPPLPGHSETTRLLNNIVAQGSNFEGCSSAAVISLAFCTNINYTLMVKKKSAKTRTKLSLQNLQKSISASFGGKDANEIVTLVLVNCSGCAHYEQFTLEKCVICCFH
jgi:hypothetical protein